MAANENGAGSTGDRGCNEADWGYKDGKGCLDCAADYALARNVRHEDGAVTKPDLLNRAFYRGLQSMAAVQATGKRMESLDKSGLRHELNVALQKVVSGVTGNPVCAEFCKKRNPVDDGDIVVSFDEAAELTGGALVEAPDSDETVSIEPVWPWPAEFALDDDEARVAAPVETAPVETIPAPNGEAGLRLDYYAAIAGMAVFVAGGGVLKLVRGGVKKVFDALPDVQLVNWE